MDEGIETQLELSFKEDSTPRKTKANHEDDNELILLVKEKACCASFEKLVDRHTGIVYKIMAKYKRFIETNGLDFEEIREEKQFLLYESILSFKPEKKVKFSTWAGNQTRYFCLNRVRKESRKILVPDEKINDFLDNTERESIIDFEEIKELVYFLLSKLKDPRMKRVFELRYFSGSRKVVPFHKIAKDMEVAPQTVVNLHNKAKKILVRKIKTHTNRSEVI